MTITLDRNDQPPADGTAIQDASGAGAGALWEPPIKLWRLYVLILLSFGLYTIAWTYGVSKDFRRQFGSKYKPGLLAFLSVIPVANVFVIHNQIKTINLLLRRAGRPVHLSNHVVVDIAVVILIVDLTITYFSFVWPSSLAVNVASGLAVLIWPVPFLMMQSQYNALKSLFADVRWTRPPNRFLFRHWAVMLAGVALFVFSVWPYDPEERQVPSGSPLASGAEIFGESHLYSLTTPDGTWSRLPAGSLSPDADLELSGRDQNVTVIVYVVCEPRSSLDEMVAGRRNDLAPTLHDFEVTEDRQIESRRFLPISNARYTGVDSLGVRQTHWVVTVVDETVVVEVIATLAGGEPDDHNAVEQLVHGFRMSANSSKCDSG